MLTVRMYGMPADLEEISKDAFTFPGPKPYVIEFYDDYLEAVYSLPLDEELTPEQMEWLSGYDWHLQR